MNKAQMKKHMRSLVKDAEIGVVNPLTDEVNSTYLAECAAYDLDCWEYLEDDQHWIWDAAVEVEQEYYARRGCKWARN